MDWCGIIVCYIADFVYYFDGAKKMEIKKVVILCLILFFLFPFVHAQSVWIAQFDQVTLINEDIQIEKQLGGLNQPTSVVSTRNNMVWIAEKGDSNIYEYSVHGDLLNTFHRQMYRQPQALA